MKHHPKTRSTTSLHTSNSKKPILPHPFGPSPQAPCSWRASPSSPPRCPAAAPRRRWRWPRRRSRRRRRRGGSSGGFLEVFLLVFGGFPGLCFSYIIFNYILYIYIYCFFLFRFAFCCFNVFFWFGFSVFLNIFFSAQGFAGIMSVPRTECW